VRFTRCCLPRTALAAAARFGITLLLVAGLATAWPGAASGRVAAGPGAAASQAAASSPVPPGVAWPNFDVSARPGNEAENTIAANPLDPLNVAAMTCPIGRKDGLFLGVSFDGGLTWARRLFATGAQVGHTCDEQLAWDRYGNLWMTHLEANGHIFVGLSTDGGLRFKKVADIVPTAPRAGTGLTAHPATRALAGRPDRFSNHAGDRPSVSVGPHSVWVDYTNVLTGAVQAAGAKVTGRGRFGSFSPPESVPTRQGHGDFGGLAVGPRGQALVIYENIASPRRSRIYTALDPDGLGPRGFGRPRLLARTRVNALDFIPAQPDRGITTNAGLAWDTGGGRYHGRVYAVWTQAAQRNRDNLNVMFQHSGNSGRTWTKAVPLNDSHTINSQFFPAIAVDQATGDIAAGWYDCRNAHGQGGHGCARPDTYTQFWVSYSTDGGRTFAPDFRVSQGTSNAKDMHSSFDYGDYTQVAFQSHLFYPAWSDNSDSTGTNPDGKLHQVDLYTALVPIP
jgi:hypothetical protein